MAEPKSRPTDASVARYLAAIEDDARRADCEAIAKLMRKVTKQEPRMWGTSIVGFGAYRYTYESGHRSKVSSERHAVLVRSATQETRETRP